MTQSSSQSSTQKRPTAHLAQGDLGRERGSPSGGEESESESQILGGEASAPAPVGMARSRGGPAPATAVTSPAVLGTVAVMGFVYYSTVFVFLDHWVGLATPAGAAHVAAVSLAVAACFLAFVCAAGADPGAVPPAFAPDAEAAQGQVGELTQISLVLLPYRPQTL